MEDQWRTWATSNYSISLGYAFENGDGAESSVNKNKGEYERGLYAHDQRL